MRYILGIGLLVWYNLHLSQGAVEHNPGADQEEGFGDAYSSQEGPQDAMQVCTYKTVQTIAQCVKMLVPFVRNGFPWGFTHMSAIQNQFRNHKMQSSNLRDPLDPINHVCKVFGDFLRCLDQHAIPSECLLSGPTDVFEVHTVFQFICDIQPRSTDLLHSLQCLKGSRVLDLLVFYLAERTGTHIDDMVQGTVNAFFRFLNNVDFAPTYLVNPFSIELTLIHGLICLPKSVISHDVAFIIDRKCGSHAAEFVRNFSLFYRSRFNSALSKMGLPTSICDKETRRNPTGDRIYAPSGDTEKDHIISSTSFDQFLDKNSPGTAMDTVYGGIIRDIIKTLPETEFCRPLTGLTFTFQSCVLLSYDSSGKTKFNVLQYAHSVLSLPFTPLSDSSRLKVFRSCWNLLQQICGPNTTYYEYYYHVSVGSREIQRMMDNLTCEWQDTLIRHYIEASGHGNWPTSYNAFTGPMHLSNGTYTSGDLGNSMSDVISAVRRAVKEISARCSVASANRIDLFYQRVNYNYYATIKLLDMMQKASAA